MKLLRHIVGFAIGTTIFVILIPLAIVSLSEVIDTALSLNRFVGSTARLFFAVPIFAVGVVYILWSNFFLVVRGKGGPTDGFGVAISPRTERLVTTGPYRNTRNPMVFGAFSVYFALAIFIGSVGGLILLTIFFVLASFYLKRVEEPRLINDFGDEYKEYQRRVSMIVPIFIKDTKKSS
jgi:protein-S-isoprenylcysteine O-methyltransferase Ste14